MKLYDSIYTKGLIMADGEKMRANDPFLDVFNKTQVIDIQNVAEMFYADPEKIWHPLDFPNIAPPFESFWMEFQMRRAYDRGASSFGTKFPFGVATLNWGFDVNGNMQEYLDERPGYAPLIQNYFADLLAGKRKKAESNGVMEWSPEPKADPDARRRQMWDWLTVRDPMPFESEYFQFPDRMETSLTVLLSRAAALKDQVDMRWVLIIQGFIEHNNGTMIGPVLHCIIPITDQGEMWDGISFITPFRDDMDKDTVVSQSYHLMNPTLFAISLMHCKNVHMAEQTQPEKVARAYKRRHGRPPTRFHILNVEPMRKVLRTEGRSESTGLKKAMHICRGHFKTFNDKPLFGKHRGMYWWDQQVRGSRDQGRVEKAYAIKAAKEFA